MADKSSNCSAGVCELSSCPSLLPCSCCQLAKKQHSRSLRCVSQDGAPKMQQIPFGDPSLGGPWSGPSDKDTGMQCWLHNTQICCRTHNTSMVIFFNAFQHIKTTSKLTFTCLRPELLVLLFVYLPFIYLNPQALTWVEVFDTWDLHFDTSKLQTRD